MTAVLTLSQIRAWRTEHLNESANEWGVTAELWEGAFTQLACQMTTPGGTRWAGEGADAAEFSANSDLLKVRGFADELRITAAIARRGEEELYAAKQAVLAAVTDAEAEGFSVNDDLSVTERGAGGPPALRLARQARAEGLAADISFRASNLVAVDNEIASRITAAAMGLEGADFAEDIAQRGSRNIPERSSRIQLVDRTLPRQPVPEPSPGGGSALPEPTAQNIQDAIKDLPRTGGSIRLVRDEAQLRQLEEWVMQNSTEYASGTPYRGGQGTERRLADGTIVRFGPSKNFGPTSDVTIPYEHIALPDGRTIKLHVDPVKGGQMSFPKGPVGGLPPVEPAPAPNFARPEPVPKSGGPPLGSMTTGTGPGSGAVRGPSGGGLMVPDADPWHRI